MINNHLSNLWGSFYQLDDGIIDEVILYLNDKDKAKAAVISSVFAIKITQDCLNTHFGNKYKLPESHRPQWLLAAGRLELNFQELNEASAKKEVHGYLRKVDEHLFAIMKSIFKVGIPIESLTKRENNSRLQLPAKIEHPIMRGSLDADLEGEVTCSQYIRRYLNLMSFAKKQRMLFQNRLIEIALENLDQILAKFINEADIKLNALFTYRDYGYFFTFYQEKCKQEIQAQHPQIDPNSAEGTNMIELLHRNKIESIWTYIKLEESCTDSSLCSILNADVLQRFLHKKYPQESHEEIFNKTYSFEDRRKRMADVFQFAQKRGIYISPRTIFGYLNTIKNYLSEVNYAVSVLKTDLDLLWCPFELHEQLTKETEKCRKDFEAVNEILKKTLAVDNREILNSPNRDEIIIFLKDSRLDMIESERSLENINIIGLFHDYAQNARPFVKRVIKIWRNRDDFRTAVEQNKNEKLKKIIAEVLEELANEDIVNQE